MTSRTFEDAVHACIFFESEWEAVEYCRNLNRNLGRDGKNNPYCVVDGPEEDYAVLPLRDAQEQGFFWTAYF